MARNLYDIYLYDRNDRQVEALSKVASFDVYFKDRYVFGLYIPVSWKVRKKRSYIYAAIRTFEQKRLLRQLKREDRAQRVSMPEGFDFQLFDTNDQRIPDTQFYKAKHFRILKYNSKTRRFRKFEDWSFPSVSLPVKDKIAIIEKMMRKASTVIDKVVTEVFDEEEEEIVEKKVEYTVRRFEKDIIRRDGSLVTASHRIITLDEKEPLRREAGSFSEITKDKIRKIAEREWNKEWKHAKDSQLLVNIRAKVEMKDVAGSKMGKDRWVNISRERIGSKEDFINIIFHRFMVRLNQMYEKYLSRDSQAMASLASLDIENVL